MNKSKLTVKEIITVTLLSLINIVIFSLGTVFYLTPITVVLTPVIYSLLQGIVFIMIGMKVKKKGAILIYAVIQGVMGFFLPYVLAYVAAGIIAEIILAKTSYGNTKSLIAGYTVTQVLAALASTIYPYAIAINKTLEMQSMQNSGSMVETITKAGQMLQGWGSVLIIVLTVAAAVLGGCLGKLVCQKHLKAIDK